MEGTFLSAHIVTVLMTLNGQSVKLGPGGALEAQLHLLNASHRN